MRARSGGGNEAEALHRRSLRPPAHDPPPARFSVRPAVLQGEVVIRGGPATDAEGVTIPEFAKLLNRVLARTTLDRTGLTGRSPAPLPTPPRPRPTPPVRPSSPRSANSSD